LKAPRKNSLWIGRIPGEETTAKVSQSAQPPFADQLPRVLHQRRPSVVVSDERKDASLSGQTLNLSRLLRILSHRFFAKDVLAGRGRCAHDFKMHVVRRSYIYDLNVRVSDYLLPAGGVPLEAESFLSLFGTRFNVVGANNQSGPNTTVVETISRLEVSTAVYRSHPAHPDDPDPDNLRHSGLLASDRD
jgi:hypothetical protein